MKQTKTFGLIFCACRLAVLSAVVGRKFVLQKSVNHNQKPRNGKRQGVSRTFS